MTTKASSILSKDLPLFKNWSEEEWRNLVDNIQINKEDQSECWLWTGPINLTNGFPTIHKATLSSRSPAKVVFEALCGHPGYLFKVVRKDNCQNKVCVNAFHREAVKVKIRSTRKRRNKIAPKRNRPTDWQKGAIDYLNSL